MAVRPTRWLTPLAVSLGLLVACSPAAPPGPTTAPQAAPTSAPAKPVESKSESVAKPAAKVEQPSAKAEQPAAKATSFQQLVKMSEAEMAKKDGKLSIALEWDEQDLPEILEQLKKEFPFIKDTTYGRERQVEAQMKLLQEIQAGRAPQYDIMHVATEVWPQYEAAGLFVKPPFSYKELIQALPEGWTPPDERALDPNGMYIATSGLARGNAWNTNLVPASEAPTTWNDCLDPKWKGQVIYDPRSKLDALWVNPETREWHLQWLRDFAATKPVLNRGQTENLEKIAAGEYKIACGINFHSTMRIIGQGAPIGFDLPDPFPLEFGTEIHVMKWSQTPATTQLFGLWLATKAQPLVEKYGYRGFPWDPGTQKFQFAQGKKVIVCDAKCVQAAEEYQNIHADILGLPGAR